MLAVLKANSGALIGMVVLDVRGGSRVLMALDSHVESDTLMVSPSAFILVCGTPKLMNFDLLDVIPCLIFVECAMCVLGSNQASIRSSTSLQQHQNAMHATANMEILNALV